MYIYIYYVCIYITYNIYIYICDDVNLDEFFINPRGWLGPGPLWGGANIQGTLASGVGMFYFLSKFHRELTKTPSI